jgi:hypothetical protein
MSRSSASSPATARPTPERKTASAHKSPPSNRPNVPPGRSIRPHGTGPMFHRAAWDRPNVPPDRLPACSQATPAPSVSLAPPPHASRADQALNPVKAASSRARYQVKAASGRARYQVKAAPAGPVPGESRSRKANATRRGLRCPNCPLHAKPDRRPERPTKRPTKRPTERPAERPAGRSPASAQGNAICAGAGPRQVSLMRSAVVAPSWCALGGLNRVPACCPG